MWADGHKDRVTGMTKLIDAFPNFTNAPKVRECRVSRQKQVDKTWTEVTQKKIMILRTPLRPLCKISTRAWRNRTVFENCLLLGVYTYFGAS